MKKKPAKDYGTGAKQRGYTRFRDHDAAKASRSSAAHPTRVPYIALEAQASAALDGETQSGCPTCGACSPPMTSAERAVVEAAMKWWGNGIDCMNGELPQACRALRAEREA